MTVSLRIQDKYCSQVVNRNSVSDNGTTSVSHLQSIVLLYNRCNMVTSQTVQDENPTCTKHEEEDWALLGPAADKLVQQLKTATTKRTVNTTRRICSPQRVLSGLKATGQLRDLGDRLNRFGPAHMFETDRSLRLPGQSAARAV